MQTYILLGFILQLQTLLAVPTKRPRPLISQTNDLKPHLNCIIFGDIACQITCDVLCDLYGCQSQARCIDQVSCNCNEIYLISSQNLTVSQYRNQSLVDLWSYNFKSSFASSRALNRVQRDEELAKNITILLRNPHTTGEFVKNQLQALQSPWSYVYYLHPSKRGAIHEILDDKNTFDYTLFRTYFNKTIASIIDRTYDKIQTMENTIALPNLLHYLRYDANIRYIVNQVLSFPDTNLLSLIDEYSHHTKYEVFNRIDNTTIVERENAAFTNFKIQLNQAIDTLVDQLYRRVQEMKQKQVLPQLMSYVDDKRDLKNIISLILMFPNDSLYNLMRNLVIQNRNQTYTVDTHQSPEFLNPQQMDELVSASVLEKLLRIKLEPPQPSRAATKPTSTLSTMTTTTTSTSTQTSVTTTSVPLFDRIRNFFHKTFASKKDQAKVTKSPKKPYPDLQHLLVKLMEYLVNSGNNNKADN